MPQGDFGGDEPGALSHALGETLETYVRERASAEEAKEEEERASRTRSTVPFGMKVAPMRPIFDTERVDVEPEGLVGALGTLTIVRGCEVGRTFALDAEVVTVGRAPECEVWIDESSVSREHARVIRYEPGVYVLEDLRSTNGTFLGDQRIERADLAQGARVQIGPAVLLRFALVDPRDELVQRDLFHAATRDALSGVYNRRYFEERLGIEIARARRAHIPLAVFMLDVDGLKGVNDAHGHLAGDAVLRAVAEALGGHVRMADVLARWGGDEFALLAPAADPPMAARLAERLRAAVASLTVSAPGAELRATLSVGVATLDEVGDDDGGDALLARADSRLYRAKRAGKDRVLTG